MPVERYDPEKHYPLFKAWYEARIPIVMGPEFLPRVGFVYPDVAMGFLYQTDSKVAHIEALVANPKAEGALRTRAIDQVVIAIIGEAQALGFKALQAQTSLEAVVERSRRFGFSVDPEPVTCCTLML